MNKKHFASLVILLLIFSLSCKKELLINKSLLDETKEWYSQLPQGQSYIKSSRGDSAIIIQEPQWQQSHVTEVEGKSLIVVPVETNLFEITGKEGVLNLVIIKVNNTYQYKIVNVFAKGINDQVNLSPSQFYDLAFSKKTAATLDEGNQIRVQGHPVIQDLGSVPNKNFEKNKNNNRAVMSSSGCVDYYWVTSYWVDDVIVEQWYDFMYSVCPGSGGGDKDTEQGVTPEDGVPPVTTQDIKLDTSITNNPKIDCLLKKLLGLNGSSGNTQMKALLQAFTAKGFNINFQIGSVNDPNSKGETTYNAYQPKNYTITLNRNKINDESQMSWVKTLLHEAFHANLMQKSYEMFGDHAVGMWAIGPKDLTLPELMDKIENLLQPTPTLAQQHHEFMAMNIGIIKNGLKAFSLANNTNHTDFDEDRFEALAYQGVELTAYYINKVCKDENGNIIMVNYSGGNYSLAQVHNNKAGDLMRNSNIPCN